MLAGDWVPDETHKIDFANLPRIASEHAVVSDVIKLGGKRVHQHNYLAWHDGLFWVMWSDGPGKSNGYGQVPHHDLAGQVVSYATSKDGLNWSKVKQLSSTPEEGFGWIARDFWIRDGELLALASRYKAPAYANPGLQLHAFSLESMAPTKWKHHGLVFDNTLNNFAPKKLPSGEWMMSRRDWKRNVYTLFGGVNSFDKWECVPLINYRGSKLAAEEPFWWVLPDKRLAAMFRDNNRGGYLYRAFSSDNGRNWSKPIQTNFPDATSKFFGVRLNDGRYALVSNANPKKRDPMVLSISNDGIVFNKMFYLTGGRHVDYPHMIEHDGFLYIALATAKQTVEVYKVGVDF